MTVVEPQERCRAPAHTWQPQNATSSWYCTSCGLITFVAPVKERFKKNRLAPNGQQIVKNSPKGSSREAKIAALIERDGCMCFYCEHDLIDPRDIEADLSTHSWWPTLDHLLPRSLGGSNDLDNLVLACRECNTRKGDHVRLLAEVINRQRGRVTSKNDALAKAYAFIEHLQWELFDAGLGEIPGHTHLIRTPRKRRFLRPRSGLRDIQLFCELGERTIANLRSENLGGTHARVAAIVKRYRAVERPRKNYLHQYNGKNPRGVW